MLKGKVSVDNRLSDGTKLFNIDKNGRGIEVGLIVVDTRVGRIVTHIETGVQYRIGYAMAYEAGESFIVFRVDGAGDMIAPAEQFSFVEEVKEDEQ